MASGKYTPGMKMKVQRTGKGTAPHIRGDLHEPAPRAVDEAYAGDIIGFTIHGGVQLGDSITDGPSLQFTGLPFFARNVRGPWCSRTRCVPSSCSKA